MYFITIPCYLYIRYEYVAYHHTHECEVVQLEIDCIIAVRRYYNIIGT